MLTSTLKHEVNEDSFTNIVCREVFRVMGEGEQWVDQYMEMVKIPWSPRSIKHVAC